MEEVFALADDEVGCRWIDVIGNRRRHPQPSYLPMRPSHPTNTPQSPPHILTAQSTDLHRRAPRPSACSWRAWTPSGPTPC